jgi:tRNA-2-methylthio-N6-dimethylallyladenosine synthase/ribosomal protein S12 methylthiotransferase
MVGFPGESEADFARLIELVVAARFDNLGVFAYAPEEPAPAAKMPGRPPKSVARQRRGQLMRVQKKISLTNNLARVGQEFEVLVEGPAPDSPLVQMGRAYFQAPEVDGVVYFDGPRPPSGQLVRARVIQAKAYDLAVTWIEEP